MTAFVAGALGRLAPEKNFVSLAALAALCSEVQIVLGGEGPCRTEIEAACEALGCRDRLRLLGRVENRLQFYHSLDVFLLPSLYEGLPMVLLEAMACGLPVIASPLPDIQHALGEAGLYAPAGSPRAWASALADLQRRVCRRESLGRAARARCLEAHDMAHVASKLIRLYEELSSQDGC